MNTPGSDLILYHYTNKFKKGIWMKFTEKVLQKLKFAFAGTCKALIDERVQTLHDTL